MESKASGYDAYILRISWLSNDDMKTEIQEDLRSGNVGKLKLIGLPGKRKEPTL